MSICPKCNKDLGSLYFEEEWCPQCAEIRALQHEQTKLRETLRNTLNELAAYRLAFCDKEKEVEKLKVKDKTTMKRLSPEELDEKIDDIETTIHGDQAQADYREIISELKTLQEEVQELQKDKARLDWLEANYSDPFRPSLRGTADAGMKNQ